MLDYIVSTKWLFMTVFFALCFMPAIVIIFRPVKSTIPARIIQIAVSLFAFGSLLYLTMGPNGYAIQFVAGLSNGKQLCLVEEHWQGSDGGSYEENRLYVLDMKSGELKYRMPVDSREILCVKQNSVVFFLYNYAEEYDLETGEVVHTWSLEEGFEKFPELKCGISDLNRGSNAYRFQNYGWLTITAKDGHQYCYDLMKDELIEAEYLDPPRSDFQLDEYSVKLVDSLNDTKWYYDFHDKTGEIKELVYHPESGDEQILEGEYLNPKMVGLFPELQTFIVRHYTTTESTSSIHTTIGSDNKIKWKFSQDDIKTADFFSDKPEPGLSLPVGERLILTFGGQVFCIRAASGKVLWKTVL